MTISRIGGTTQTSTSSGGIQRINAGPSLIGQTAKSTRSTFTPYTFSDKKDQKDQFGLTPSIISKAPKKTAWQKIGDWFDKTFVSDTETKIAQAQNAYAIKKIVPEAERFTLAQLAEPGGNILKNSPMQQITKEIGLRGVPTPAEYLPAIFALSVGVGLIEAPLSTVLAVGIFETVSKIKSNFIRAITGKPLSFRADESLSNLVPNANPGIKNMLDVIDLIGTGAITHKIFTKTPDLVGKLTTDTLTKYNMPKSVKMEAETIRNIFKGLSTQEQTDLFTSLNLSESEITALVRGKHGVTIEIPAEKIVTLVDKPYWTKIKAIFGKIPNEPITIKYSNGETTVNRTLAGYLQPGEYTSQEITGKIINNNIAETAEGRELLKNIVNPENAGQKVIVSSTVDVSKTPKEPVVEKEVTVFRGAKDQTIDASRENGLTGGVSFSTDKAVAERFAQKEGGTVTQYKISSDAKTINHSELENMSKEEVTKFLKDNKIDVVKFDVPEGAKGEEELRVINEKVLVPTKGAQQPVVKEKVVEDKKVAQAGLYDPKKFKQGFRVSDPALPKGFEVRQGFYGAEGREQLGEIIIYDKNGKLAAGVDYGKLSNEISVKFIETKPEHQRKGLATFLNKKLKEMYPGAKIDLGMTTPEGTAFTKSVAQQPLSEQKADRGVVKQAQKVTPKPVGEGRGVSKVGVSIEAKAIEKSLARGFDGTALFDTITIKEQAKMASKLLGSDIEKAKKIVLGQEKLPQGMREATILKAMEDYALSKGDVPLLQGIANSPLASGTSAHAQELRLLAERSSDSPVTIIRDIMNEKAKTFERKTGKDVKKEIKKEVEKIKKEIKAPDKYDWSRFLESIICK